MIVIQATRKIELKARDSIFADGAFLSACGGKVEVEARHDISMNDAVVRAFRELEIESKRGDVHIERADLAITDGSTRGDIEVEGETIFVEGATLTGPDDIELDGTVDGTATIVNGTKPC